MDFLPQARRVLFLPCQSDRVRHTRDTFYIYWKTRTSWCFLCSAERAAASIFRAKRHKAHNDFGRNESAQRRKTHGEMKVVSNWLHFFGVAKPWHGSTLWLSHTAGLVTIVDKDGGTFQTRGFSLLTPHVLHSITPPLLSFCPCSVPSFTFPPPLFLSLCLHSISLPRDLLLILPEIRLGTKMSYVVLERSIYLDGSARKGSSYTSVTVGTNAARLPCSQLVLYYMVRLNVHSC